MTLCKYYKFAIIYNLVFPRGSIFACLFVCLFIFYLSVKLYLVVKVGGIGWDRRSLSSEYLKYEIPF